MNMDRYPYAYLSSLLPSVEARTKFATISRGVNKPSPRRCFYGALRYEEAAPSVSR